MLVLVLIGLPLLKLAVPSKAEALSRHSARRAMPATISGESGATCNTHTHSAATTTAQQQQHDWIQRWHVGQS